MNVNVYLLKCLTNMHMGSGDTNYNVIDLEVERDPVTGQPTMNASGVKGALRDFAEMHETLKVDVDRMFGTTDNNGEYKFFAGDLLARPVRVTEGTDAYALATTPTLIADFVNKVNALAGKDLLAGEALAVGTKSSKNTISVEGMKILQDGSSKLLNNLLGEKWVVGSDSWLSSIDLPVIAHNVLDEKKRSVNLWFEEYVPHESVFGLIVLSPDDKFDSVIQEEKPVVQFGAEASTGCGYVRLTKAGVVQ